MQCEERAHIRRARLEQEDRVNSVIVVVNALFCSLVFFFFCFLLQLVWCAGFAFFCFLSTCSFFGWQCTCGQITFLYLRDVYLCLVVCDHRAPSAVSLMYEA